MDYTKNAVLIHELAEEKWDKELSEDGGGNFTNSVINEAVDAILDLVNEQIPSTNNTDDYRPYPERWETYFVPVVFAIIFIIGVLGNGTLIVTFIKYRTMRNVPNMYICSLAVGDILVIFFCVPFTSTVYTVESWPYGLIVCKFSEFIKDVSIGVSVFTLTALSADRYFAIVDPMRKLPGRRATRITCITIAGIWLASLIIALPSVLFSYIREFGNNGTRTFLICYPFPEEFGPNYPRMIVMVKFLVYYAIPLFFIATFYVIMARHLVLSTKNMPGEMQGQARQIQGRKKVAKMVLSFVVIFALCFFPSHLFFLWFYFDPDAESHFNEFWNIVRIVGFCLSFINSCINPITLYCVSGTFRKHFDKHLFCCCCNSDPHGRGVGKGRAGGGAGSMSNNYSNHHIFHGSDRIQRNGLCRHQSTMSCAPKRNWIYESNNSTQSNHQLLSLTTLNAHAATHHYNPHNPYASHINSSNLPNKHPHRTTTGSLDTDATEILMSTRFDGSGENYRKSSTPPINVESNGLFKGSSSKAGPSGGSPGSAEILRGPAIRMHGPSEPIVEPQVTITSFIENAESKSMESLNKKEVNKLD